MSNWRRQKPRNNNNNYNNHHHQQQRGTTITQSLKPPLANCKPSVPAWEKDFCAKVGSIPWSKVVEAKRFMHLYDRVVQWDDSAGEDAFKKAKSQYWAEINGVPSDLPSPDPDVYIDDVDWDAQVDTELILDLERGPDPIAEGGGEHVVILDALFPSGQYSGQGWGDAEGVINEENVGTGKPDNSWDDQHCDGWNQDSWGRQEKPGAWDHNNNDKSFKTESWDYKNSNKNSFNYKKDGNWNCKDHQGRESREWRKRGAVPRGGDRVEDCGWRNGRGRSRGGFQQHSNGWGWTESF